MMTYLPFFISFLIGFFLIGILSHKEGRIHLAKHILLASGIGLGISGQFTFLSYIFFDQLNIMFIQALNYSLLIILGILYFILYFRRQEKISTQLTVSGRQLLPLIAVVILSLPLWSLTQFYLYGGWDAWSTWNLKARFLFLGDEDWRRLFDPVLWRSSPHYPLLLPLINVWGWTFSSAENLHVPAFCAYLFTFLTVGMMYIFLQDMTKSRWAFITVIVFFTLPFFNKISLSQYADNVVGYYLITAILCLITAKSEKRTSFAFLSGLSLGLLAFAKPEGFVAAAILGVLAIPYCCWQQTTEKRRTLAIPFVLGAAVSLVIPFIFYAFFAPENQTMINGLVSTAKPSTFYRLKVIVSFYLVELVSPNWNGLWVILLLGLLFSWKRCFNNTTIIIPIFLIIYTGIITAYYFVNTYFTIDWWLQVSLHRILFSVIPVVMFWVFFSLWKEKKEG